MTKSNLGLLISFLFIFFILAVSTFLGKLKLLNNEGTRKFIHISVSNWWIIAMFYFENKLYAAFVPSIFIVLNFLSYRYTLVEAMERDGGKKDLGTVYYPISLLILVLITFSDFSHPYVGGLGILIMGYGDGLAAIIGKKFGKHKYTIINNEKSLEGSLSMFTVSFLISLILLSIYSPSLILIKAIIVAGVATVLEAFSPFGLDNLTVPILVSAFYQIFLYR